MHFWSARLYLVVVGYADPPGVEPQNQCLKNPNTYYHHNIHSPPGEFFIYFTSFRSFVRSIYTFVLAKSLVIYITVHM